MTDTSTSIFPHRDKRENLDSDAGAPTLMSLPSKIRVQILSFLLPDKDVLRLARGWEGHYHPGFLANESDDDDGIDDPYPPIWRFDDEFRYDKDPVQTAIFRVNRLLYEEGSQILYGRTVKVDVYCKKYYDMYGQRSSYYQLRDFPWAKVRKVLIVVHSLWLWEDLVFIRAQLLILCGLLVSSESMIKKLHVLYRGDWDPTHAMIISPIQDPMTLNSHWDKSEVDVLRIMLEPLRQLTMVRECKIQLPARVQKIQALTEEVHRYIRGIKDEEPFVEEELQDDRMDYLNIYKWILEWEEADRQEAETALIRNR